ncbi:hypothetical protein PR202_ga13437 [Eleusine coracana subsp. coracana]|uniref:Uncharacterized protein n=1 Tax=Eleusine coracana subsp. coracana TaxID=191504 RepID=A0AAV5CER4_ELECO|nr:hypothetical protein PR202_ga13437 [Eleusine coracana subsp. coracana]
MAMLFASAATLLLVLPLSTAQPLPWQACNATAGNFTEKSAYQANIRRLAAALPRNASSSPALFATGVAGSAPDAVYALAHCRGDTNASSCASCVAKAFDDAQQLCAFRRGATMYDDPCILRYADWDFLANATDNRGLIIAWSYDNVSSSEAPAFDAASGRLVNATADYAAADPVRRFGTGEEPFGGRSYPRIYSLAQCTPDMTAADCRTCLGDVIRRFTATYFTGKHGGRVFGVRCSYRFETYSFFSGRPLLQLQGPPPPPGNVTPPVTAQGRRRNRTGLALAIALPLAAAILALLTVTCFCFWSRRTPAAQKDSEKTYSTNPEDIRSIDPLLLHLSTLQAATDNFAESNKLGEGGFGAVYKISDFGLAKLFDMDQSQGVTSHIAGTYGYMAPEYAMHGQYSVKSDVFSLGVLILEMVTGRKNTTFNDSEQSVDLLSLVWEQWTMGTIAELLDQFLLGRGAPQDQMSKLVNIGLLCVQDSPADRPMVSSINVMLSSDTVSLQVPSKPTFCIPEMEDHSYLYSDAYKRAMKLQSTNKSKAPMSPNEVTLTDLEPR